ncbi:hypothetical protein L596_024265 [Steinernema carpocapsae]|uniref:G-protein coupled receptors family 1 profile domain-containing protein n=1 Tax=Steinernema carpocapsae TaxID=34508 RepID=A0A4U5MGY8_STECR|nr:hypothetical protein L596_024265 [Steinernema carpocapsae]
MLWEDDCRFRPSTENYVVIVAFVIIFCLSVIGNSIVIVVIVQQRTMRSITNLYLLNLAITDLLLSVVCMPPTLVSSVVYCWMFGDLMCKVLAYLQPAVVTASAYTLASIAIERYYAICQPLHSRVWATKSHAYMMISIVWVISLVSNIPMLFMYELRTYGQNGLNCAPRYNAIVHFGYQIYMTAVLLMVPLVMMTVLYGIVISSLKTGIKIEISNVGSTLESESRNSLDEAEENEDQSYHWSMIRRLRGTFRRAKTSLSLHRPFKSLRAPAPKTSSAAKRPPIYKALERKMITKSESTPYAVEQSLRSTHSEKNVIAKQRVIKMLVVIVIIFFCCWTPSYIWWLLLTAQDSFGSFNVWNSDLNTVITILTYLSSCTNPITYCFLNQKFRTALLLTFGCRRKNSIRGHFQKVYMPPQNPPNGHLLKQSHGLAPGNEGHRATINRSVSTSSNLMAKMRGENPDDADIRRNSASMIARKSLVDREESAGFVISTNNNTIQNLPKSTIVVERSKESIF